MNRNQLARARKLARRGNGEPRLSPQEIAFALDIPEAAVWKQALHADWTAQYRSFWDERPKKRSNADREKNYDDHDVDPDEVPVPHEGETCFDVRKGRGTSGVDAHLYWLVRSGREVVTLIHERDDGRTPKLVPMGCGVPFSPQTTCEDIHPGWTFPPNSRLYCPVCHRHGCEDWRANRWGWTCTGDPKIAWGPVAADWRAKMVKPKPKDRPNEGWPNSPEPSGPGAAAPTYYDAFCDACGGYGGTKVKHLVRCVCKDAPRECDAHVDYRRLIRFAVSIGRPKAVRQCSIGLCFCPGAGCGKWGFQTSESASMRFGGTAIVEFKKGS